MKTTIINFILQTDEILHNNIDFVTTVNDFIHKELEQPKLSFQSKEECMQYINTLNEKDFLCLSIILINKVKDLNFEEEDILLNSIKILLSFQKAT